MSSLYDALNHGGSIYSNMVDAVKDTAARGTSFTMGFEAFNEISKENYNAPSVSSVRGAIQQYKQLIASNEAFGKYIADTLGVMGASAIPSRVTENAAILGAAIQASIENYDAKTIIANMYPRGDQLVQVSNESQLIADNLFSLAGGTISNEMAYATISNEAFANGTPATIDKELNIAYNMASAIQDQFIEAFFPTVVRTPDQNSFLFRITIDSFYNGYTHDPKKKPELNFGRVNLIEATRKPEIILREELRLVPHYRDTGTDINKDIFLSTDIYTTEIVSVGGIEIPTAPLKLTEKLEDIALFSESRHPELVGGVFDETDQIDASAKMKSLFVQLKDGNEHVVEFPVAGLDSSLFVPVQTGNINEMLVDFRSNDFVITKDILNTKGTAIAGFDDLLGNDDGGYHVRCTVEFTARVNLETGVFTPKGARVVPFRVTKWAKPVAGVEQEPTVIPLDDATLKAQLDKLSLKVIGFEPLFYRTNQNLRTMGLILDYDEYFSRYNVTPKSPVRVQHPLTRGSQEQRPGLEKLIVAARTAKRANGYRTFFNFESNLKSVVTNYKRNGQYQPTTSISGIATKFLAPVHIEAEFNVKDHLIYTETKNLVVNIRHAIENHIHWMVTRMVNDSNYVAASSVMNGSMPKKPKVIIGTSVELAMFLSAGGPISTLTDQFDYEIVSTNILDMKDRIYITITGQTDSDRDGIGAFNFGHTFVYPDTVVTVSPHNTNNRYAETTLLVPRYEHVPNSCVLGRINVVGIDKLMVDAKSFPTRVVTP